MQYRNLLIAVAVAVLCLVGAGRALAAPTFQPEVLLMKSANDGQEKSFDYAKLRAVTPAGADSSATFRYRADVDTVTCTIQAGKAGSKGAIPTMVTVQRETVDGAGHKSLTTSTEKYTFTPGKSLIVDTRPHAQPDSRNHTVEILQITLQK